MAKSKPLTRLPAAAGIFWLVFAFPVLADGDYVPVFKPLTSSSLVLAGRRQGSGFLIDAGDRMMLTNHHVVASESKVSAIPPLFRDGQVLVRRDYYLRSGHRISAKVVASDTKIDLALVQLDEPPAGLAEMKLATASAREGDRVHMIGNPGNKDQVWVYSIGKVSKVAEQKLLYDNGQKVAARILSLTADGQLGRGASGGPVVNDRGELIGVISAGSLDGRDLSCIELTEVRRFLGTAYRKLATAAIGRRDYFRAIAFCDKALRAFSRDPLTHNERGVALSFIDSLDAAIDSYTDALKLDSSLAKAYRNRGSAYFHKGKYEQAVADCTEAIRRAPDYVSAYQVRAKAFAKLNRPVESQADTTKAKELAAKSP